MFYTLIEMSHVTYTNGNDECIIISTHVSNASGTILSHSDYIHKDCTSEYDWQDAMKRFETFTEAPDTIKTYDKIVPDTDAHFLTYELRY